MIDTKKLRNLLPLLASPVALQERYDLAFTPGVQQHDLIMRTCDEIVNGRKVLEFLGCAGTGKTTTLTILLSIFAECGATGTVCALSWKAANRASEVTGLEPKTVHGIAYAGAEEDDKDEDDLRFNQREKPNDDIGDYLIVDERSMVGANLMGDLFDACPRGCTIILVGDTIQLPPIGEDEVCFDPEAVDYMLTEVYRQAEGNSVLAAATEVREKMVALQWSPPNKGYPNDGRLLRRHGIADNQRWDAQARRYQGGTPYEAACKLVDLAGQYQAEGGATAVVAQHKSRVALNDAVRSRIGLTARNLGPAVGERLVAMGSGAGVRNSTQGRVEKVSDLMIFAQDEQGDIDGWLLDFRVDGEKFTRAVVVLREAWMHSSAKHRGSVRRDVNPGDRMGARSRCEAAFALAGPLGTTILPLVAAKIEEIEERTGKRLYSGAARKVKAEVYAEHAPLLLLEGFVSQLDTGYAITCWKAQGSQWGAVLLVMDFTFIQFEPETEFRYWYTALTRASHEVFAFHKDKASWAQALAA